MHHPGSMFRTWMIFLASAALLAVSIMIYSFDYYIGPGPTSEEKTVVFRKGMGFVEIVDKMHDEGVIDHPRLFKAIAVVMGDARKFKAGEYKFSPAISPKLIMDMIAEGRVVVHKITVPEGFNVRQVAELLMAEKTLEGDVPSGISEGSLLPDTYHFVYGDQRGDLIERMKKSMAMTINELWESRASDLPFETQMQALTLASLVEKETGVKSERGLVASVYINRLRKGMKLQCDPTVIYGIELEKGPMTRALTRSDLQYPTPYNTYINYGLPPGPIANPGREAIAAVLNPPDSPYLFFVATGNGGHNFSVSYGDHNKNVTSYRKELKKKKQQPKKK